MAMRGSFRAVLFVVLVLCTAASAIECSAGNILASCETVVLSRGKEDAPLAQSLAVLLDALEESFGVSIVRIATDEAVDDVSEELLAQYLAAGFDTRQLANTYNSVANVLEQAMTLGILVVGALLVIDSAALASSGAATFTIGMLVAFHMFASRMRHPLLRLENAICTPHLGYVERGTYESYFGSAVDNILGYVAGKPVNVMTPDAIGKRK
jgi:ABC-type multidrug transport system fused ATPase/permease subunit